MLAAWLGLLPLYANAQTLSGGETLREPLGVRQTGMGEAFTALSGDVQSLHYNPAGLADLAAPEIDTLYAADLFSAQTAHVIFGTPVAWIGSGSLALDCYALLGPAIEINNLDGTSESLISQRDLVVSAGYGQPITPGLSVGAAAKFFHSTLVEEYSATAVGGDVGMLYQGLGLPGISLGAALQNLGTPIKYLEQSDPMPTLFRVGFGYATPKNSTHGLRVGLDLLFPNDQDAQTHLGMEYGWQERFFLRGGYKLGSALESFTVGAGLLLNGLSVNYSFAKMAVGPDVQRFGLGYRFGTGSQSQQQ
jgi:hypothetical protein